MANDSTLIYRAQTGDEEAFAALMREYYPFVYTIVIRIVDNPHDVEEVIQDTFLSAYQGLTQLEDTTKFKSWLAEIARNCARQWVRKQRIHTVSLDEVGEGVLQTQDSPDEQLTRQEQRELIRRTMETLPQKDREIARAFYLEGASYDELTSTHGLSDKAISFRLSRAKQRLSKRLRYLLTGVFVSPGLTLKKLYMRGLTGIKVGTAPKITVGATGLIALIIIGFIGLRQMNAPIIEERVYLSPWEDGRVRPQNNLEGFPADITQDRGSRNNLSQIAAASTARTESVDDFLDQLDETDMTQFATETDFELNVEQFTTDISTSSENTGQSAEDVMYAYLEAYRNFDSDAIYSLMTAEFRHRLDDNLGNEPPLEPVEKVVKSVRERNRQAEVESSKYVGDEFHFRLRTPPLDIPIASDQYLKACPYQLIKIRKEKGVWRIYNAMFIK